MDSKTKEIESHKQRIEQALSGNDSIGELRACVLELKDRQVSQQKIYDIFYTQSLHLQEANRKEESEQLEDVMDMITGWYLGKNIDFE